MGEAENQIFREFVGIGRRMLQLETVALGITCGVSPHSSSALHRIDFLGDNLLEPTIGQPVCAGIGLAGVLAWNHERLLLKGLRALPLQEKQNVLMIYAETLVPPGTRVPVPMIDTRL